MDIADWLRGLGLERYETAFRENDVSAEVLCDLTAEDLRDSASPPSAIGAGFCGHSQASDGAPQAVRPTDDQLASLSTASAASLP